MFFYFSGQGYFQKDDNGDEADGLDETLVPFDAKVGAGDPPEVAGMITDDELVTLMRRLQGRKVTIAVDAGHSGFVSAGSPEAATNSGKFRVATLGTKTRSIVVEPAAKAQKAEGPPLDTGGLGPDVAVFTADLGRPGAAGRGRRRRLHQGLRRCDQGQGRRHQPQRHRLERRDPRLPARALQDCLRRREGLRPRPDADARAGGGGRQHAGRDDRSGSGKLTADQILDFFAKGNTEGVTLEQIPPSPIKVGTKDVRFRVTSPTDGSLVLLDLSDDGTLTQLFPNSLARDKERDGRILAGSPITVPDDYYGIHFNATSPTSGTLIALVTTEPIDLPVTVKTRKIEVIPREQATQTFLPAIAAALDAPADTSADTPTRSIDWSVATLRYEIVK